MSERKIYGSCQSHCKEEVYSKTKVDEFLQSLEAGKLQTLAWYKGIYDKFNYEYSGIDPKSVSLTNYNNLIDAICSGGIGLAVADTDIIFALSNFNVKVYHEGSEFYATKDTTYIYIQKNNHYVNKISTTATFETINIANDVKTIKANDGVQDARLKVLESKVITKTLLYENEEGLEIGLNEALKVFTMNEKLKPGDELEIHLTIEEKDTGTLVSFAENPKYYPMKLKLTYTEFTVIDTYQQIKNITNCYGNIYTPFLYEKLTNSYNYSYNKLFIGINLTENEAGGYDFNFNKTIVELIMGTNATNSDGTNYKPERYYPDKSIKVNKVYRITEGEQIESAETDLLLNELNGEVV